MRVRSLLVTLALLGSTSALAEYALFNVHLDPMVGTGLDKRSLLSGAALKVDTTIIQQLGPIAPQVEVFGVGAENRTYLHEGQAFGIGFGARVRFFNDEKGYYLNPGKDFTGTLWSNAWVDAHFLYIPGPLGIGFDVGAGVDFSVVEGLSVGPFVKFVNYGPHQTLSGGLSFTIGAPETTPVDSDYDGDGITFKNDKCPTEPEDKNGIEDEDGCPEGTKDGDKDGVPDVTDKCPTEPEDKDGFEDDDGCPDFDNDKDGLEDSADKCPDAAGPKENSGCPDGDKDGDTVADRLDKCPEKAGPPENGGCPDTDQDEDGTPDRLDKCIDVKGEKDNEGCPYPDTDGDTVVDRFDNCPTEAGPPDNQGCPVKQKQLIVITREKIVIKETVYFAFGKARIQKRSFTMLEQIATVLKSHDEIKQVQIEGHTDNVGSADTNRSLSQARADAVKAFLVGKGIDPARLKSMGFGPDRPADTNDTDAGREKNRRVEFNIVDQ